MGLYTAVKSVAKKQNKSVYRIERDLKMGNGTISRWDKAVPRADTLQSVADYLGVTPQYLFSIARNEK